MWLPSAVIEGHHGMSLEGRLLGRVYISSDLRDWYARAWQSLRAAASLLVVAALLAYLLSDRLHRLVTGPIARLRESMQAVSADRDYAVRVEKTTGDEVGELIDRFNGMLEEIQRRDAALQSANETLEQRVAERSAALEQRANALTRSEEQLRHQTEMLQSVLHGMGDGVIVAGDGRKGLALQLDGGGDLPPRPARRLHARLSARPSLPPARHAHALRGGRTAHEPRDPRRVGGQRRAVPPRRRRTGGGLAERQRQAAA